jgi:hypothetical protein
MGAVALSLRHILPGRPHQACSSLGRPIFGEPDRQPLPNLGLGELRSDRTRLGQRHVYGSFVLAPSLDSGLIRLECGRERSLPSAFT